MILRGTRAPELLIISEKLKTLGNIGEVLDESRPAYDLKALYQQYKGTLIGDYLEYFLSKKRNAVEERALYYGLQALLETSK